MPIYFQELKPWLWYVLSLPAALYYLIKIYLYLKQRRPKRNLSNVQKPEISRVLRIEQQEASNHPPAFLSVALISFSLLILAFGFWGVYLFGIGKVALRLDIWTILFFILFLVVPISIMVDFFIVQPKYDRLGKSMVAKEATVIMELDAGASFDACFKAINTMKADIIRMRRPSLLKARYKKSVITLRVRQRKGSGTRVHILSDSEWLTVRFDMGANQRCINTLLSELSKQ